MFVLLYLYMKLKKYIYIVILEGSNGIYDNIIFFIKFFYLLCILYSPPETRLMKQPA